ncbi:MAG: ABC transporter permease [Myxococcota bacterium]|nr:ABC transporter permease [Myxococcota bacterium]
MRAPRLLGLHASPGRGLALLLAAIPFVLIVGGYWMASSARLAENPNDKLLPAFSTMAESMHRLAFTEDKRSGGYVFWQDTLSSLRRLGIGVGLAALVGLAVGLPVGLYPGLRSLLLAVVTFLSIIPPLALLPILFISFGVDELSKVVLIFLGTVFVITRDVYLTTRAIPAEQITKALTLGATHLAVATQVVLPQVLPRLLDTVRLTLGAGWLFLIAAEAIASTDGLGYRIFLMRRYLAMDVILPYVLWITLLGFVLDWTLRTIVARRFGWYEATRT